MKTSSRAVRRVYVRALCCSGGPRAVPRAPRVRRLGGHLGFDIRRFEAVLAEKLLSSGSFELIMRRRPVVGLRAALPVTQGQLTVPPGRHRRCADNERAGRPLGRPALRKPPSARRLALRTGRRDARSAPARRGTPGFRTCRCRQEFLPRDRYQNPAPAAGSVASVSVGPGRLSKQTSSPPPGPPVERPCCTDHVVLRAERRRGPV